MNALKLIFNFFQVFTEHLEHPEYPPLVLIRSKLASVLIGGHVWCA